MTESNWLFDIVNSNLPSISPMTINSYGVYTNNRIEAEVESGSGFVDWIIDIRLLIDGFTITRIDVQVDWERTAEGVSDKVIEIFHDSVSLLSHPESGGLPYPPQSETFILTGNWSSGELKLVGRLDYNGFAGGTDGGYLHYSSIIIHGEGLNPFISSDVAASNHNVTQADCPICSYGEQIGGQPILLRTGEKLEQITDLSVNTPTGALAFTRSYRQSKNVADPVPTTFEDGFTTPLGAGWTHNHDLHLIEDGDTILLKMPSGGIAQFTRVGMTSIFTGDPGSNTQIDNSGSSLSKYTLTASDESVWVFDDQNRIRSRTWANGEVWTYEYYEYPTDPLALDGLLKSVSDGYGRGLQFAYHDISSSIDYQQLKHVGDHTVADIFLPVEGERYVEFAYTENKKEDSGNPGTVIAGGQALLNIVTDVLGKDWTYGYETEDLDTLNWIIQEDSPSVDVDGDNDVDGVLTLKRLTYYPFEDLAINGDMEADSDWTDVASPTTNARVSTPSPVYEGTYSRHVEADTDAGIGGSEWDLEAGRTYTLRAHVYPVSGGVEMCVSGLNATFPVSNGTGAWQELVLVLKPEFASTGHKLQFLATAANSEFYVDAVTIEAAQQITQERGKHSSDLDYLATTDYVFQPGGKNITTEITASREIRHYFANGVYAGPSNPAGNYQAQGLDTNYRPVAQVDANGNTTNLSWSSDGKKLNSVIDALSNETSFTYDDQDRLQTSTDAEDRITTYLYDADRRQPSLILVADTQGSDLIADYNGDMEDTTDWSDVGTPTSSVRSSGEVDAGDYSWYVEADQDEGIENDNTFALTANKTYLVSARVFVNTLGGQVKMNMNGVSGFEALSQTDGEWETLLAVHTPPSADAADLQFLANGGAADFYVDSVHVVEIEGLHRWQHFAYDEKGRTLLDALVSPEDASLLQATKREYGTTGNGAGLLETIRQLNVQAAGVDETITTYTYDAQGRVIKTEKSSLMGTCQFTYTVYDNAGNVLGTACGLVNTTVPTAIEGTGGLLDLYNASDETKKHTRITTHIYDAMGRRVSTTVNAGTSFSRTSRTIYDALSRVVRTIDNYVVQYDGITPVAPGAWVWNASSEQWEYSDIDSTPVSHGTNNDENIISDTDYNERGLIYRRRDVLGRFTLSGYDLADRLVKTVQNASQPDYDASYATGDPQLRRYRADSSIVDGDVISEQFYDANGNLIKSIDARGSVSYTVYDKLNRPVRTVQNAKATATIDLNVGDTGYLVANDPRVLGESGYEFSLAPDEDIIAETTYDDMGRVVLSRRLLENRNTGIDPIWDETYFVYDELGRQKRVIQHYVVQGTSDPADWVYESGVWKQAPSGTAISHGNNDQNIITETVYDVSGRVKETLDVNRRVTRFVYDGLNRQVMTIANFVAQATEPEAWAWSSTNEQWEYSAGNAVSHGTNNDENIISHTEYDDDGRVFETRNVEGLIQRNAYDLAGRNLLTIQNFVDNGYVNPAGIPGVKDPWSWDAAQTRWEDGDGTAIDRGTGFDQNIIAKPDYDDEGRVFQTRDSRGNLTHQVYDEAGRRVMTISNYVAQGSSDPADWEWASNEWQDGASNSIEHRSDPTNYPDNYDQNRISHTTYDILGRVVTTRDAAGRVSYTVYDDLGRRTLTIANYVAQANPPEEWEWDAVDNRWEDGSGNAIHSTNFDVNIISQTVYNRAGQVVSTRDARGTETTFEYDGAGRRVMVTATANTGQRARTYTCYDKAGRVLRTIQGYEPTGDDPDTWEAGEWEFAPTSNGYHHDENRITEHEYDAASRRVKTINPEGDEVETAYFLDGQVDSMTDPMGVVTVYRYDQLNRRKLVVQNYVSNGEDPALWVWDTNQYEESDGTPITHGTDNDENIIVQVDYDIAGRMTQMRDPRGKVNFYTYDRLGRRTNIVMNYVQQGSSEPQDWEWVSTQWEDGASNAIDHDDADNNPLAQNLIRRTTYDESGGATSTTLTDMKGYETLRDFDLMGRLLELSYGDPANTYDVRFAYDILGNRELMTEYSGSGFSSPARKTTYGYDDANRLTSVGFDNDGGGTVDDTVSYEYDLGGRRTKLTMPGSMEIAYTYDQKGRLIALTDWDGQTTSFAYDKADRHVRTRRSNGLDSLYQHDAAGRLRTLHHLKGAAELRQSFAYAVNALGNRTQAQEITPRTSGATEIPMGHDYPALVYRGDWNSVEGFHEATVHDASVSILFYGETATLKIGKGPDYSLFDIYIDGTLWLSYDGYEFTERDDTDPFEIEISVEGIGLHLLEVKNRLEHNVKSSGYKLRFHSLVAQPAFDVTTIDYGYDSLSRLLTANYNGGATVYTYGYDVAGNLVNNNGVTRTYNAANQIVNDGTNTLTYDANGNLTNDGVNSLTWDRANRMLTAPGSTSYKYDGAGNRIQQTVSSVVTGYLNDVQPGLVKLLRQDDGTNVDHFVHAPRGIHAVDDGTDWTWYAQDGLGSVRGLVDDAAVVVSSQAYNPIGVPDTDYGAGFGFTGEQTDANDLLYLRARYYAPDMGVFTALDPFEGMHNRPMSLNGYSWVEGNVPNMVDPSGMQSTNCVSECEQYLSIPFDDCAFQSCLNSCLNGTLIDSILTTNSCRVFIQGVRGATGSAWENEFPIRIGDPTGTKFGQALRAEEQTRDCGYLFVAGYSFGADTAIIFANRNINRIKGLALLGPTISGNIEMATGPNIDVVSIWENTLSNLLQRGTYIYILNDETQLDRLDDDPPINLHEVFTRFQSNANPSYLLVYDAQLNKKHYSDGIRSNDPTSTNNDVNLVQRVVEHITTLEYIPPPILRR